MMKTMAVVKSVH